MTEHQKHLKLMALENEWYAGLDLYLVWETIRKEGVAGVVKD